MWLLYSPVAFAQSLPQQKGIINDNENDFELGTVAQLGKLAETHKAKSANEIAIVTTASCAPYKNMEEYAKQLASTWALGKTKNNGVLIILSQAKNEAKIIAGSALKTKLSDAVCQKIISEKIQPKFKEGNYDQAAIDCLMEVIRVLEK